MENDSTRWPSTYLELKYHGKAVVSITYIEHSLYYKPGLTCCFFCPFTSCRPHPLGHSTTVIFSVCALLVLSFSLKMNKKRHTMLSYPHVDYKIGCFHF